MKITLSTLIIILFSFATIHAQETGTIKGKIISADGFPLKDISIKLGKGITSTKTNTNGEFSFTNFPVGNSSITLEGNGLKK